jgi:hypothetical protein
VGDGTLVGEGHNGDENAHVSRSWSAEERVLVAAACRRAASRLEAECEVLVAQPVGIAAART